MSACSSCPVRDVGKAYPKGDENDPWRRMPKLMERLVATFGGQMYNRASRTRRDTEARVGTYCARTRGMHGEHCNGDRMRICCAVLHGVAERAGRSAHPYPVFRAGLGRILSDERLYAELANTRKDEAVDHGVVFEALDHCL